MMVSENDKIGNGPDAEKHGAGQHEKIADHPFAEAVDRQLRKRVEDVVPAPTSLLDLVVNLSNKSFDTLVWIQFANTSAGILRNQFLLSAKPEISSPFYGYGFSVSQDEAGRIAEHGGDGSGIESSFRMYLDSGYTVAVLSNYNKPAASIVDNVIHQMIISK